MQKSTQGRTNKYSNLVNKVKDTSNKKQEVIDEEPYITAEQVVQAFRSFGFEPNERNNNDIGYWTTRKQSEGVKLIEELRNKRNEINKLEDDAKKEEESFNKTKKALPRLSDEEISELFDEYGLSIPDFEWARSNLPNDPQKIRKILEVQRKMMDDMIKKESKNKVTSIPEIQKQNPQQQTEPQGMMGMGGPFGGDSLDLGMGEDIGEASPFFMGDYTVVRLTNKNNPKMSTLWLVDPKKKVLRPFKSEKAFMNAFEDPESALKSITTISTKELGKGGALNGYKLLGNDKGINDDGSMDEIDFSEAELQNRYGKEQNEAAENKSIMLLDGLLGKLNK